MTDPEVLAVYENQVALCADLLTVINDHRDATHHAHIALAAMAATTVSHIANELPRDRWEHALDFFMGETRGCLEKLRNQGLSS